MAGAELTRDAVHRPVLIDEVLEALATFEGAIVIDGTVGAGGHARAIADKIGPSGKVVGFDRDPQMLALAAEAVKGLPVVLVQRSYSAAKDVLKELGVDRVHGVLLDLGLSSDQLAWTDRGFSFSREGPLDMRFDPEGDLSAADIVNHWDEQEIADVIFQFGEERNSRRIARGSSRNGKKSGSKRPVAWPRSFEKAVPASGERSTRRPGRFKRFGSRRIGNWNISIRSYKNSPTC